MWLLDTPIDTRLPGPRPDTETAQPAVSFGLQSRGRSAALVKGECRRFAVGGWLRGRAECDTMHATEQGEPDWLHMVPIEVGMPAARAIGPDTRASIMLGKPDCNMGLYRKQ